MSKRVMIGLFALSLVALVWTDADAGCTPCCPQVCASWITGSGNSTGLVTVDVSPQFPADNGACSIETCQVRDTTEVCGEDPPVASLTLKLRLLGTDGQNCGFAPSVEKCRIKGFAVCKNFINKKVTTPGPLKVTSAGFAQTDKRTNSANFRFQVDNSDEQTKLCDGIANVFQAFVATEGSFEACVTVDSNGKSTTYCNRQFCTVGLGGLNNDIPQVYACQQLPSP